MIGQNLSLQRVDITTKTRRPQPKRTTKNDRDPSASKSSCIKNKEVKVEEHHMNLLFFNNKKHMSSECNNVKLAIQNDKSEVVCTMCKQCLITANHYVCVLNYVNGMNSHGKKQKENVSNTENQKKQKSKVKKSNKLRSKERLASRMPSKPRSCLRWSPTRRIFDLKGKIISSSKSKCQFNRSDGKSKKASYPLKHVLNSKQRLHLLHMDLCGPMRVESINGKRINNDIEFKNQVPKEYFDSVGISHQASSVRTPQQNGVVERRNQTLVEAARTIKLDISFLHVFEALCYPKNDREDIGKLGAK
ncbi:retrovirus-related pol polyprotein from transposon TNT 1-94, partial [Tanacetum coccineum]